MNIRSTTAVVLFLSFLVAHRCSSAQDFALRDGDTVVFYGDSITAQRFYTRLAEEFVLTRYPALHVRFINAGVPGDTVYGGYAGAMPQRVEHDVAPFHPTMITIMLGMNDGGWGYTPAAKMNEDFQKGYSALLDALHTAAPGANFTLINPTPYDEITHATEFPGYSSLVAQLSADVTTIASARARLPGFHIVRADFQAPLLATLGRAERASPQLAPLLIPDRIHPAEPTHWIMAAALLRAWHADPIVSSVSIHAASAKVTACDHATVSGLSRTALGIRWTQLDRSLPLPIDWDNALMQVVLSASDLGSMDQETLTVDALNAGRYELLIDGKAVGRWSGKELGAGVNLALVKTAMLDQARGVDWTEERRMTLDQAHFILQSEVKATPGTPAAEDTLTVAEQQLDTDMREKLTPKSHNFEVRYVGP